MSEKDTTRGAGAQAGTPAGIGLGRDALLGLLLALLVVVTVLFSTGVDSSFIYIDF
jgi:hypothetical protein